MPTENLTAMPPPPLLIYPAVDLCSSRPQVIYLVLAIATDRRTTPTPCRLLEGLLIPWTASYKECT